MTGFYRNRKTGNRYVVVGIAIDATNATNGREMVMYMPVYEMGMKFFVREASEFNIKFEREET